MHNYKNKTLEYWELKSFFQVKGVLNVLLIITSGLLLFLNLALYHFNEFELKNTKLAALNLANLVLLILFILIYFTIQFKKIRKKIKSKLEKQHKKISLLFQLRDKILSCTNAQETADTISYFAAQVFDNSSGVIYNMHPDYNYLEAISIWGNLTSYPKKLSASECLAICAHTLPSKNSATNRVYAPMIVDNNLLGLMQIEYFKDHDGEIEDQNQEMIENMANFTALAFANTKLRESLKIESTHDALTGLSNRRELDEYLVKHLSLAIRQKTSLSLILFDLDFFKKFNDTFGHEAGDELLTAISDILRRESRLSDAICRYGGEEFIWILYDCPLSVAKTRAEDLREKISTMSIKHAGKTLPAATISAGVSVFPGDGENAYELIESADKALYEAKVGRNKVTAFSDIKHEVKH